MHVSKHFVSHFPRAADNFVVSLNVALPPQLYLRHEYC
jgi:hypothetical protein